MLAATERAEPLPLETAAKQTEAAHGGLRILTHGVEEWLACENAGARATTFARMTQGPVLFALGWAAHLEAQQVEALLVRMRTEGSTRAVDSFGKMIKEAGAKVKKQEAARAKERRATAKRPGVELLEKLALDGLETGDLRVPPGYEVGALGVYRVLVNEEGEEQRQKVVGFPVLLTGRLVDDEDGVEHAMLAWWTGSSWRQRVVPRKSIQVSRELAELSALGFPANSMNAGDLIKYFEAFYETNVTNLPTAKTTKTLGWKEDGSFLWGTTLLRAGVSIEGETSDLSMSTPFRWRKDALHLVTADGGKSQLAGYRATGTWEGWKKIIARIEDKPVLLLVVAASLVPPLLKLIPEAQNFIFDLYGETSKGKTTALRLGSSVWGYPSEHEGGLIATWDSTLTYLERTAAQATDLPLFLDDSKRVGVKNHDKLSQVVYAVAQGRGRGRGTVTGVQATVVWRTVLVSTGEGSLVQYSQDGGTRSRTLSSPGSPLQPTGPESADLARWLQDEVMQHHGHCGPRFVAYLQANRAAVIERYRKVLPRMEAASNGNPVASRLSSPMTMMYVAFYILEQLGALSPGAGGRALQLAWSFVHVSSGGADRATAALSDLVGWSVSNQEKFWGRHRVNSGVPIEPNGGFAGAWKKGEDWEWIAFRPTVLKKLLEDWGYHEGEVMPTWLSRGWLDTNQGRQQKSVRLAGEVTWCVAVRRTAIPVGAADEVPLDAGGAPASDGRRWVEYDRPGD